MPFKFIIDSKIESLVGTVYRDKIHSYPRSRRTITTKSNMDADENQWPNSAIIPLVILLVTILLAPIGWVVQRYWVQRGMLYTCHYSMSQLWVDLTRLFTSNVQ